jgi:hypothetical protein
VAEKLYELRKLPKTKLLKLYDQESKNVMPSLNYYRDEIIRREQGTQTKLLMVFTILMLIATVISAIGVFIR